LQKYFKYFFKKYLKSILITFWVPVLVLILKILSKSILPLATLISETVKVTIDYYELSI